MSSTRIDLELHQRNHSLATTNNMISDSNSQLLQFPMKKKRSHPGTPDPDAEVIALSPKTLMTTNRFICGICHKGFQRDQNLQLHRRGHNLPWRLKQRAIDGEVKKKVYVCPETSCVHHSACRALGDLTGIKKHYSRKHGEKKWTCDKCSKKYAVESDWKAHSKICGSKQYKCGCGTIFSRRDSFMTHRAFCDALAQEAQRNQTPIHTNMDSSPKAQAQDPTAQTQCTNNSPELGHGLNNASMSNLGLIVPNGELMSSDTNPTSYLHFSDQSPMGRVHFSVPQSINKACTNNWPMIQRRSSFGFDMGFGPSKAHGPIERLPEQNQVVGNASHSSGDGFHCYWLDEMGMYADDRISVKGSDGLTEIVRHEHGIAMTLDLLGVEGDGKLHSQQQQQQQRKFGIGVEE